MVQKAGSARILVLAYQSLMRRQARQNGEICFAQFPIGKKAGSARILVLAYQSLMRRQARQNGEVCFAQFPIS